MYHDYSGATEIVVRLLLKPEKENGYRKLSYRGRFMGVHPDGIKGKPNTIVLALDEENVLPAFADDYIIQMLSFYDDNAEGKLYIQYYSQNKEDQRTALEELRAIFKQCRSERYHDDKGFIAPQF